MAPVLFEIDRTKRGGRALYELLITSSYATLVKQKIDLSRNDNERINKEQMYAKIDKGIIEFKQGKSKKLDVSKINSFLGL